ncbi:thioredoxin domain-containing protein [Sinomonas sp. ASV322]|uniref:thioredoxin domain-containing protein n=1 Tax=Sinomonas sp. ASV322 TaxID=3041920 RepID=UPI0027DC3ED8|nr:thioredoxin domain-containing protein [Sinomonas sp. ASV322]MDQ4500900.1 thioredoxin domain-containing protein [Sinomonas sp. ASV322]
MNDEQPTRAPWAPPSTVWTDPRSAPSPNPPPYPAPASPPPPRRTEPLAIASLVCSFFVSLLGVVFGHVALSRIRRSGDDGRGLAVAGLVIGYTGLASAALAVALVATLASSGALRFYAGPLTGGNPSNPSSALPDRGPRPANMNANGGIRLLADGRVEPVAASDVDVRTLPSPAPLGPGSSVPPPHPPGADAAPKGQPPRVVVYVDFACPYCAEFHASYGPALDRLRDQGRITVEYRPVAFLDHRSTTRYSLRAANAAACVANGHPDRYAGFLDLLYARQPSEGSAGLSDDELKSLMASVGAEAGTCVDHGTYVAWARYSTRLALDSGINGVPAAFVDGRQWSGDLSKGPDFLQFLQADFDSREGVRA